MSLILALALSAGMALHEPDLDKRVTMSLEARTAVNSLRHISETTGVPLEVSRQLANEVLVVCVEDVPLRELLDKIARVTNAVWKERDGVRRLTRPPSLERELRDRERRIASDQLRKEIADWIQKEARAPLTADYMRGVISSLQGILARAAQPRPPDPRVEVPVSYSDLVEEVIDLRMQSPIHRLVLQLMNLIPPDTFFDLEDRSGMVFSTRPTPVQTRIPGDVNQAMLRFSEEWRVWQNALIEYRHELGLDECPMPETALLFVHATRERTGHHLMTSLFTLDDEGNQIESHSYIEFYPEDPIVHGVDCQCHKLDELVDDELAFVPSPRSLRISSAGPPAESTAIWQRSELTEEQREFFLHPERNEVASLGITDALFSLAQVSGKDLVANLPDDANYWHESRLLKQYVSTLVCRESLLVEDGWILLAPEFPVGTTETRRDREKLRALMRLIERGGVLSLADRLVSYDASVGCWTPVVSVNPVLQFDTSVSMIDLRNWELELFCSLSPSQVDVLRASQIIPYRALRPAQRKLIEDRLYRSGEPSFLDDDVPYEERQVTVIPEGEEGERWSRDERRRLLLRNMLDAPPWHSTSFLNEASFCLPSGVPMNAWLEASFAEETLIATFWESPANPLLSNLSEFSNFIGNGRPNPQVIGHTPVTRIRIKLRLHFTPDQFFEWGELFDDRAWPGPLVARDKLPPELLREIERLRRGGGN